MSGDEQTVPVRSAERTDVSALEAAANRSVLEVPPESIAAALRALGETAFSRGARLTPEDALGSKLESPMHAAGGLWRHRFYC